MGGVRLTQALAVSDDAAHREAMDRAYSLGDHQTAREQASTLLSSADGEVRARAERVLSETEPDRFIEVVALLGLCLVAWLVYHYVL